MKKLLINMTLLILILIVLYGSITFFNVKNNTVSSPIMDVTRNININDLNLKVKYISGNMIDEKITFGNILEKKIEITNNNEEKITYSITFKEVEINNDLLTYSLKISSDKESYTYLTKNKAVTSDMHIGYNLVIEPNSKLYISIEFKSNKEGEPTNVKGILDISDNLTDKDLFINNTKLIKTEIDEKIKSINGIVNPGIYLVNLNELSSKIYEKYKGYVLIDAKDISQIKYIYYIYSNQHMLKGYEYKDDIDKSVIQNKDNVINTLNDQTVCALYTKETCPKFSTLKYNKQGNKEDFHKLVTDLVSNVKTKYTPSKTVMIYDIKKDIDPTSSLRGYILINNISVTEPEYYLYLTNNIYMISGYNLTKNGVFTTDSTTIRAYNETAFNLSSLNAATVCTFSGFTNCVDINNVPIK